MSFEQIEQERGLSDKEMIKKGAEYEPNLEDGSLSFKATGEQVEKARKEMTREMTKAEIENFTEDEKAFYETRKRAVNLHRQIEYLYLEDRVKNLEKKEIDSSIARIEEVAINPLIEKIGDKRIREIDRLMVDKGKFELEDKIAATSNIEELSDVILRSGGISGGNQFYEPIKLFSLVKRIKEGTARIKNITRSLGLRDKVIELLEKK